MVETRCPASLRARPVECWDRAVRKMLFACMLAVVPNRCIHAGCFYTVYTGCELRDLALTRYLPTRPTATSILGNLSVGHWVTSRVVVRTSTVTCAASSANRTKSITTVVLTSGGFGFPRLLLMTSMIPSLSSRRSRIMSNAVTCQPRRRYAFTRLSQSHLLTLEKSSRISVLLAVSFQHFFHQTKPIFLCFITTSVTPWRRR